MGEKTRGVFLEHFMPLGIRVRDSMIVHIESDAVWERDLEQALLS